MTEPVVLPFATRRPIRWDLVVALAALEVCLLLAAFGLGLFVAHV